MNDDSDELTPAADVFLPEPGPDAWDLPIKLIIVAAMALLVLVNIRFKAFIPLVGLAESHGLSATLVRPSILWFGMGSLLLIFRTFLWFTYRPHPLATFENAPRLTVVIPAYNEGAMVARSIDSVAAARYPADRLEIIVVDDGSQDDTWFHIQEAAARHGDRVLAIRLERNQGKREALAAAFKRAKGEVFVTVDSDSVVAPNALLALAGPFSNPRIGVVAGRVLVYNRHEGLIPRMLHVRFTLSFDFLRAYQSTFGTVYCSPGALSGYRASAVKMVLEPWLKQQFLGARATIGEDRALTNDIMRLGYDSIYQRAATVQTIVPVTYNKLCRMLLRWDRSYVREELRFATIVWKRPPLARMIAVVDSAITNMRYPVMCSTFLLLGAAFYHDPRVLLRVLAAVGLVSTIYSLFYLRSERSFNIVYGILFEYFSFFLLFWIFPWAVLTVRVRGWLTR